jgi:hypothetical protein
MPPQNHRKPAHQNTFAFRHNPNSKRTVAILATPNVHVCRRCHEKIEWRKAYRKYKPRTGQPGKCNLCQQKRVTAAYHTICEPCTHKSTKAQTLLREWNAEVAAKKLTKIMRNNGTTVEDETTDADPTSPTINHEVAANVVSDKPEDDLPGETIPTEDDDGSAVTPDEPTVPPSLHRRVCAVCVKEPALPDKEDDEPEEAARLNRPLKLRERKRLERLAEPKTTTRRRPPLPTETTTVEEALEDLLVEEEEDSDDEQEDPLLAAVGGADQLLTGEAYQAKLLQQHAAAAGGMEPPLQLRERKPQERHKTDCRTEA